MTYTANSPTTPAVSTTPTVARLMAFRSTGLTDAQSVSRPPVNRMKMRATIPTLLRKMGTVEVDPAQAFRPGEHANRQEQAPTPGLPVVGNPCNRNAHQDENGIL